MKLLIPILLSLTVTDASSQHIPLVSVPDYRIDTRGGPDVLVGGIASYGIDAYSFPNPSQYKSNGASCPIQGFITGGQSFSVGLSGVAAAQAPGCTNVATAGVGIYPPGGRGIGLYGRVAPISHYQEPVIFPSGALVLDISRSTYPAIVIINGTNTIFEVTSNGTVRARSFELID